MNEFSHGFHGQRYCSWARTHDDDDDDDGNGDGGVAQHGGHTPANRSTETCTLGLQQKNAIFLGGIFKEKTHFYLLCRQTIAEVDLMFLRQGCTEGIKKKARRSSEEDREKERASAGEGGDTVLNNAVNYGESRARERK